MTQDNSLFRHKLFIDNEEVLSSSEGKINFTGSNQLNTCMLKINDIDIQHKSLFNKKVELFLNESGQDDSLPLFRGFVKEFTPFERGVNIKALDVRSVLSGQNAVKITLTDEDNFDGKTLAQYIYSVITDNVNTDETIIGLDMLRDSNPVALMQGLRGVNLDAYKIITDSISTVIDDTDFMNPLSLFIDVREDSEKSNIIITKDKQLTDTPSYTFSFSDGIRKLTFKRRLPANTAYYKGRSEQYTNRPNGQIATTVTDLDDVAKTRNLALKELLLAQQQQDEINLEISKAYDIGLGTLIHLEVPEDDVKGVHRVQSKSITFGKNVNCTLILNKKPIKLSDYIQRQ
mgnify:FL=1